MMRHVRARALPRAVWGAALVTVLFLWGGRTALAQDVVPAGGDVTHGVLLLNPIQDATIDGGKPTANYGNVEFLEVAADVENVLLERHTLIEFDLSMLPRGTAIQTATLRLQQLGASNAQNASWTLSMLRPAAEWDEATVTWENYPGAESWASFPAPVLVSPHAEDIPVESDLTTAVNLWVNSPASFPNRGLDIWNRPPNVFFTSRAFASRESDIAPTLTVSYTLPPLHVCLEVECVEDGANALVHNLSQGTVLTANASGVITTGYDLGDVLWARAPISSAHDGTLYHTMQQTATVETAAFILLRTGAEMPLVVTELAPLWVQDLDFSAQWHVEGAPGAADALRTDILSASHHLYAITDGQFILGRVRVYQRYASWETAHLQLYASNTLRPRAYIGGVVETEAPDPSATIPLSYTPGVISMGSYWNRFGTPPFSLNTFEGTVYDEAMLEDDWSLALAHEFGHYLLFLFDTYTGIDGVADLDLTRRCIGTAMGDVYTPSNRAFIWNQTIWDTNCRGTEAHHQHQGRVEWETIRAFYPWAQIPTGFVPGPNQPPAAVTTVEFVPAADGEAAAQQFTLVYQDDESSSGEARAFLLQQGRVIEQGKPPKNGNSVQLTGAEVGDQLCVYDINDHAEEEGAAPGSDVPRHQFGCEVLVAGDDTLIMTKDNGWGPQVALVQSGPQALQVQVKQPLAAPGALRVQIYPEHGSGLPPVVLPVVGDVFSTTITFTEAMSALYARVYVEESPALPATRREVMVDRGTGGGGAFGPAKLYDGVLVVSSDGNAGFQNDEPMELGPGESIAWQSMPGTPPLPIGTWISGQSYRLDAFPSSLVLSGTIWIRFDESFGLPDAGAAGDGAAGEGAEAADAPPGTAMYFFDGTAWEKLETTISTPTDSTDGKLLARAPSQGVGVYAILSDAPPGTIQFLPLVHLE